MHDDPDYQQRALHFQLGRIEAIYNKIALQLHLSESAFWILYLVSKAPYACSQQDIYRELSLPKTTVNSAVQTLCRKGLVNLERAPNERRTKMIRLTKHGADFAAKYIVPLQEAEQKAFLALCGDERRIFVGMSKKYAENLTEEFERLFH